MHFGNIERSVCGGGFILLAAQKTNHSSRSKDRRHIISSTKPFKHFPPLKLADGTEVYVSVIFVPFFGKAMCVCGWGIGFGGGGGKHC